MGGQVDSKEAVGKPTGVLVGMAHNGRLCMASWLMYLILFELTREGKR